MASAAFEREAGPKRRRATYADLAAVPEPLVAEILDGELFTHPRPSPKHAFASNILSNELTDPFQLGRGGPGGWIFLPEPELHLDGEVLVPDIAGWRIERLPQLPETPFIETSPDWVCEILSPSTEYLDRGRKRRLYGETGVRYLWLLDPRGKFLETFTLLDGQWIVTGTYAEANEDETGKGVTAATDPRWASVCAPPFDAISFPLSILWPLRSAAETQKDDN